MAGTDVAAGAAAIRVCEKIRSTGCNHLEWLEF